jgi:hypothetical protein
MSDRTVPENRRHVRICDSFVAAALWSIFLFLLWVLKDSMIYEWDDANSKTPTGGSSHFSKFADGYYSTIDFSMSDRNLTSALNKLISNAKVLKRTAIVQALQETDENSICGPDRISDVYSGHCWKFEQRCGNAAPSAIGECYNREHLWPQSWCIDWIPSSLNFEMSALKCILFALFCSTGGEARERVPVQHMTCSTTSQQTDTSTEFAATFPSA